MKRKIILISTSIILLLGVMFAFDTKSSYTPIIVKREVLDTSIASMPVQKLVNPGKMFVKGSRLYVIEKYYGVHVFDNSNPSSPVNIGFIRILGCSDITLKDNVMYASSAVDLVTIDITNILQVKELNRQRNVLPEILSPQGIIESKYMETNRPDETIIIAWK